MGILGYAFPAFFYIVFYRRLSSKGKRAEGDMNGMAVRIPRFLDEMLFPGAAYDRRPLETVIWTAGSLISAVLTVVLAVLMGFSRSDQATNMEVFRLGTAVIFCIFLGSLMIGWLAIAVRDRRLPLIARIIIIAVILLLVAVIAISGELPTFGRGFVRFRD